MKFQEPVFTGKLLKRYKRFFADLEIDGEQVTAHVPNTGSLKGVLEEGQLGLVTKSSDPKRKLAYTLQMLEQDGGWVGVNTQWPNKLVVEAYAKHGQKLFKAETIKAEYKISPKTRLDFALLNNDEITGFVEVKNVTLAEGKKALFPDCVTARGLKHIEELMELQKMGHSCEMLYVVQRMDCTSFSPAYELDKSYAEALKKAADSGLTIKAYKTKLDAKGIELDVLNPLKIEI